MTDDGNEFAFHLFGPLAFGDVAYQADEADFAMVADLRDPQFDGEVLAIAAHGGQLAVLLQRARFASNGIVVQIAVVGGAVGLGHQYRQVAPDDLLAAVAEDVLGGMVEGFDDAALVDDDDGVDHVGEQQAQIALAFMGLLLGQHPLGHVPDETVGPGLLRVRHAVPLFPYPDDAAVGLDQPVGAFEQRLSFTNPVEGGAVLRVNQAGVGTRAGTGEVAGRVAGEPLDAVAQITHAALAVVAVAVDHAWQVADHVAEAAFAFLQRMGGLHQFADIGDEAMPERRAVGQALGIGASFDPEQPLVRMNDAIANGAFAQVVARALDGRIEPGQVIGMHRSEGDPGVIDQLFGAQPVELLYALADVEELVAAVAKAPELVNHPRQQLGDFLRTLEQALALPDLALMAEPMLALDDDPAIEHDRQRQQQRLGDQPGQRPLQQQPVLGLDVPLEQAADVAPDQCRCQRRPRRILLGANVE